MTVVSPQERDAMARLMQIMEGQKVSGAPRTGTSNPSSPVELAGPGQVTQRDVTAMADVLRRLESVVDKTHATMVNESVMDRELGEALITEQTPDGVRIGSYQIRQGLDEGRIAGKQFYNVVNSSTGETLANELSLYETAHGLVKLLNQGKFFNTPEVHQLLEWEQQYTSHRIDAVRFHRASRRANKLGDDHRSQLMETRKQASLDKSMTAKRQIREFYGSIGR
jgi:hypothetical protein